MSRTVTPDATPQRGDAGSGPGLSDHSLSHVADLTIASSPRGSPSPARAVAGSLTPVRIAGSVGSPSPTRRSPGPPASPLPPVPDAIGAAASLPPTPRSTSSLGTPRRSEQSVAQLTWFADMSPEKPVSSIPVSPLQPHRRVGGLLSQRSAEDGAVGANQGGALQQYPSLSPPASGGVRSVSSSRADWLDRAQQWSADPSPVGTSLSRRPTQDNAAAPRAGPTGSPIQRDSSRRAASYQVATSQPAQADSPFQHDPVIRSITGAPPIVPRLNLAASPQLQYRGLAKPAVGEAGTGFVVSGSVPSSQQQQQQQVPVPSLASLATPLGLGRAASDVTVEAHRDAASRNLSRAASSEHMTSARTRAGSGGSVPPLDFRALHGSSATKAGSSAAPLASAAQSFTGLSEARPLLSMPVQEWSTPPPSVPPVAAAWAAAPTPSPPADGRHGTGARSALAASTQAASPGFTASAPQQGGAATPRLGDAADGRDHLLASLGTTMGSVLVERPGLSSTYKPTAASGTVPAFPSLSGTVLQPPASATAALVGTNRHLQTEGASLVAGKENNHPDSPPKLAGSPAKRPGRRSNVLPPPAPKRPGRRSNVLGPTREEDELIVQQFLETNNESDEVVQAFLGSARGEAPSRSGRSPSRMAAAGLQWMHGQLSSMGGAARR